MYRKDKDDALLENILKEYLVPFPDESEIDKTVECVQSFVPVPRKVLKREKVKRLLYNTALGFNYMQKWFFLISILLYAMGYFVAVNSDIYVYSVLFVIAPIPVVVSLLNVFRGREENVYEIELTCKITPQEIAVSKIFIACLYNTVLNFSLSLFLYDKAPNLIFWKVTMLWLLPMVITGAFAIIICSKVKSTYAVSGTLAFWFAAAVGISAEFQNTDILSKMHFFSCSLFLIIGIAVFVFTLKKMTDRYYFERGTNYETDNR